MSIIYTVGLGCMCLSIWAVIQLTLMGVFYYIEVVQLIDDVEEHEPKDFDDFVTKTTENYSATAYNCWIVAGIYLVILLISCVCMFVGRNSDRKAAARLEDDEIVCQPILPKVPEPIATDIPKKKNEKAPKPEKKEKPPKTEKEEKAPKPEEKKKKEKEDKAPKPEEKEKKEKSPKTPSSPKKKKRSAKDKSIVIV